MHSNNIQNVSQTIHENDLHSKTFVAFSFVAFVRYLISNSENH